jgi:hypothetical protein
MPTFRYTVNVSATTLANMSFWTAHCTAMDAAGLLAEATMVRVEMGDVRDFFRPVPAETLCDMLRSGGLHQWSPDGVDGSWFAPPRDGPSLDLGGSAGGWQTAAGITTVADPNDVRTFLSFWGSNSNTRLGGCCSTAPSVAQRVSGEWAPEQFTLVVLGRCCTSFQALAEAEPFLAFMVTRELRGRMRLVVEDVKAR